MSAQTKSIIDKLLTNVSNGLFQREGFVADLLFPPIKVKQQSGLIATYGNDHLRILNTVMAGGSPAPRVDAILLDSGRTDLPIKELGGTGRTHDHHAIRC